MSDRAWWRHAAIYEVYLRSFKDSNADGVGDLPGLVSELDHIASLGADAIWITPFYPSPQKDHGYDVSDYREVDPIFGDLDDFRLLIGEAHDRGLRVITDLVPNHVSDEHPWFAPVRNRTATAAEEDRFIVRRSFDGEPPNNWESFFGGPAWAPLGDGNYYLHSFTDSQPDLNWRNPDVVKYFYDVLAFWVGLGVDGFRIDVAHGLFKDAALRDNPGVFRWGSGGIGEESRHSVDQPEIHALYREWRSYLDELSPERHVALLGEVYLSDPARRAAYTAPGELDLVFEFGLLWAEWSRDSVASAIGAGLAAQKVPAWVLESHDSDRTVSRYGGGPSGIRRALAMFALTASLPGVMVLYQGQELGLADAPVAGHATDPLSRTQPDATPRDVVRVPLPWSGNAVPYGFSAGEPWLDMPDSWASDSVAAQSTDEDSFLNRAREIMLGRASIPHEAETSVRCDPESDLIVVTRKWTGGGLLVVTNFGPSNAPMPEGAVILRTTTEASAGVLRSDETVWLKL